MRTILGPNQMKVLVIEDHPIVVSGYRQLLADCTSIVIEAKTIAEARLLIAEHHPDVIIINSDLPDGSGLDFVRKLMAKKPKTRIVVFCMTDEVRVAMQAIDYGAKGFISKNNGPTDFVAAVLAASRGEMWISDNLLRQIAFAKINRHTFMRQRPGRAKGRDRNVKESTHRRRLTRREKNVLGLLISGFDPPEIATKLNISSTLISSDCAALCEKFDARTTAEMVASAVLSNFHDEFAIAEGKAWGR